MRSLCRINEQLVRDNAVLQRRVEHLENLVKTHQARIEILCAERAQRALITPAGYAECEEHPAA